MGFHFCRLSCVVAAAVLTTSLLGQVRQGATPEPSKQEQAAQRITSVEGITEYRLSNGLRVLLYPEQSKPVINVNITYLVGSR